MRKMLPLCSGVALVSMIGGALAASDSTLYNLVREKREKMNQLEQCAKKVTGFKIAGISTLGLTAVGIGGNVALSMKQKGLNTQIEKTQGELASQKATLADLEKQISQKKASLSGGESVDMDSASVTLGGQIGDYCPADDINDPLTKTAVYRETTGTGLLGDIVCTNSAGQLVMCICSAEECLGGEPFKLAGGIQTCTKPAEYVATNQRVMGASCSRADIEETAKFWGVASKTLEAKYMPVSSDYGMVCKDDSNDFGGETYCLCGATKCDPNGSRMDSEGLPTCMATNEQSVQPLVAGRVLGRECNKADVEFTNRLFASENADATTTRTARYKAVSHDYGMECEETSGSKETVFCLCEATDCEGNSGTTHDGGLSLCLAPLTRMQANTVKPLQSTDNYVPLALQGKGNNNSERQSLMASGQYLTKDKMNSQQEAYRSLCEDECGGIALIDIFGKGFSCYGASQSCMKPKNTASVSTNSNQGRGKKSASGAGIDITKFNNPASTANMMMNLQKNMMPQLNMPELQYK